MGTNGVPQSELSTGSNTPDLIKSRNFFSILPFHANGKGLGLQNMGVALYSIFNEILFILNSPKLSRKTSEN